MKKRKKTSDDPPFPKLTSLKYAPHSWPGGEKPNNDLTIPHWQTDTTHWQTPHTDRHHTLTDRCHILPDATHWQTPHTNRQMPHSARCYTLTDATHWHHTERQTPHTDTTQRDRHHTLTDTTHWQTPHTDRHHTLTDRHHTLTDATPWCTAACQCCQYQHRPTTQFWSHVAASTVSTDGPCWWTGPPAGVSPCLSVHPGTRPAVTHEALLLQCSDLEEKINERKN